MSCLIANCEKCSHGCDFVVHLDSGLSNARPAFFDFSSAECIGFVTALCSGNIMWTELLLPQARTHQLHHLRRPECENGREMR